MPTNPDEALARAWELAHGDFTEAEQDELDRLLPTLVDAGYAEAHEDTWRFTPKGVERADSVTGE